MDSVTWRTAAFDAWQELVVPWLARYSRSLTARHLLYKGLRSEDPSTAAQLITDAFTWLDQHGTTPEAQFVLGPLLERDLDSAAATAAVGHAFTWLDQHGTTPEARFILKPLLNAIWTPLRPRQPSAMPLPGWTSTAPPPRPGTS